MKRHIACWSAALLVGSLGALVSASPASALDVCVGTGTATTVAPLFYPVTATAAPAVTVHAPTMTPWAFAAGVATCAPALAKAMAATGVVSGWCGHSSGSGVTANGYRFAWVTAGGTMVFTGGLTGIGQVEANVFVGDTCVGGADDFLIEYAGVKTACGVTKTKSATVMPAPATTTTVGPLTVVTAPWVYFVKVCVGV